MNRRYIYTLKLKSTCNHQIITTSQTYNSFTHSFIHFVPSMHRSQFIKIVSLSGLRSAFLILFHYSIPPPDSSDSCFKWSTSPPPITTLGASGREIRESMRCRRISLRSSSVGNGFLPPTDRESVLLLPTEPESLGCWLLLLLLLFW